MFPAPNDPPISQAKLARWIEVSNAQRPGEPSDPTARVPQRNRSKARRKKSGLPSNPRRRSE